ncbi:AAA family ATPase [Sediminitomix flava]|uniref:MoxR-like ATPase n=1 Tax=Sediminitomix flava TaxID=379075 RepID=A0A315ZBM8_SEDFL|nr:MoxR family ATPase [Sediminitomix flava]PWJ42951.1 MoxR-like ATPase [Sediminitomix flava]
MDTKHIQQLTSKLQELKAEVAKVIIGQEEAVEQMLIALLANGHALLEGVPGVAKTLMVNTLAKGVDLGFNRIQFTPDLMPTDILGTEILRQGEGGKQSHFEFVQGPIFTNVLLADEINRTPPKTQAALLEAMQEKKVTYAGKDYKLDEPFFIVATQNPIEQAGTFQLPEAQLDRFLLYVKVGYLSEADELQVLLSTTTNKKAEVNAVLSKEEIKELQYLVREVSINEDLVRFVNQLIRSTRPQDSSVEEAKQSLRWGAGPRAGQALILTAKARALMNGRFAVIPEDLEAVAKPVLRHRILLNFQAIADGTTADQVIDVLFSKIELKAAVL